MAADHEKRRLIQWLRAEITRTGRVYRIDLEGLDLPCLRDLQRLLRDLEDDRRRAVQQARLSPLALLMNGAVAQCTAVLLPRSPVVRCRIADFRPHCQPPGPSSIRAVVEDDGQGIDHSSSAPPGLGLAGIRERVGLLDGVMKLESAPGEGTTVAVEIPLEQGAGETREA